MMIENTLEISKHSYFLLNISSNYCHIKLGMLIDTELWKMH